MTIADNSTIPVISPDLVYGNEITVQFNKRKAVIAGVDEGLADVVRYGLRQQGYLAFCPEDSVIENWIAWVFGLIVGVRLFWRLHWKSPSAKKLLDIRSEDCCAIKYFFIRKAGSEFVVLYNSRFWQLSMIKREVERFKAGKYPDIRDRK